MRRDKKRRGMLALTVVVSVGLTVAIQRFTGGNTVRIDAAQVLGSLNLSGSLPELRLDDIPIRQSDGGRPTSVPVTAAPAPVETEAPTPTPVPRGGSFTLTAGGSVIFEDGVRQSGYYKDARSDSEHYDFDEIFSQIADEMNSDLNMVTLENLVVPSAKVSNLIAPAAVMRALTSAGIDTVALGFAKACDNGYAGVASTVAEAEANNLRVIGAFAQEETAEQQIISLGGVRTALLHYTSALSSNGGKKIKKDGREFAIPLVSQAAEDISAARDAGADVVIVSLNWGSAGKTAPAAKQKTLAQQLADAGADVIIGAGSRVVQPPEWLTARRADGVEKRVLCVYSLGCLISENRTNSQVAGMLLKLRITCDEEGIVTISQASYVPTYVWRWRADSMYSYRVVASDQTAPDGMESAQINSMERALKAVQKAVGEVLRPR